VPLEDRVAQILEEKNLSITELAKKLGISRQALYAAFAREKTNGRHSIDYDTAERLAEIGGRSIQWVLTGADVGEPAQIRPPVSTRRGSLRAVREKLYKRYDKHQVDAAIGASDFIDAAELNELDAFDYLDTQLAAAQLAEQHQQPGIVTSEAEEGVSLDDQKRSAALWPRKKPGKNGGETSSPSNVPPRPRRNVR
jgi:transcriptional regulator with XRE-family HTH domain